MYTQFFELNEYKPDKLFKDCVEFPIILAVLWANLFIYEKSHDFMSIFGL